MSEGRIPRGTVVLLLPKCPAWAKGEREGSVTDHRGEKIWVRLNKSGSVRRVSRDEFELKESSFRTAVS